METITTLRPETIEGLRDLIAVNADSARGFAEAADEVEDPALERHFRSLATERDGFAERLKSFVEWNGEDEPEQGSFRALMHRWWVSFRSTLEGGDAHAILAAAERGEDRIKAKYEEILPEIAANPVSDVLHRQFERIKSSHDHIRDLRDATK